MAVVSLESHPASPGVQPVRDGDWEYSLLRRSNISNGETAHRLARDFTRYGTDTSHYVAGELYRDQAYHTGDTQEAEALLTKAQKSWLEVVRRNPDIRTLSGAVLSSMMRLCELPIDRSTLIEGRSPSPTELGIIGESLGRTGMIGKFGQAYHFDRYKVSEERISGALAELEPLLLLLRFGQRELGVECMSYFAAPSTLRQDLGKEMSGIHLRGWDISLGTFFGDRPEITDRIQVKATPEAADYDPAIAMLHPWTDLALGGEMLYGGRISFEYVIERTVPNDTSDVTKRLDKRTEQLFDAIEAPAMSSAS